MATAPTRNPINYPQLMRPRNGERAQYIGKCDVTGKHRCRTFVKWGDPASIYTTWLLDDYGSATEGRMTGAHDYVGPAA
jgi:hypothetical protein